MAAVEPLLAVAYSKYSPQKSIPQNWLERNSLIVNSSSTRCEVAGGAKEEEVSQVAHPWDEGLVGGPGWGVDALP